MLVLGEGGSGKTSLVVRLLDTTSPLPTKEETTRGINITPYIFKVGSKEKPGETRDFRLNIWDFGGQQIYHATHRFFLSSRSIYVLVADTREGGTDFNYWFRFIEKFGENSPILPIINEKFDRTQVIENFNQMRDKFPTVSEKIHVNLLTNSNLSAVRDKIHTLSRELEQTGSKIPKKWNQVRKQLESDKSNYITYAEYLEICTQNGLTDEDGKYLSGFFHNLGVFLHFCNHDLLCRKVFLQPRWVTNSVFRIIDDPIVKKQNGEFTKVDASKIWHEREYEEIRLELLEIMKNFLLIYQVNGTDSYVMPQRLSESQPIYDSFLPDSKNITYKYDEFMPRGILHQLIVSMHEKIAKQEWVWYSGAIFKYRDTLAEVLESYTQKTISIRIKGSFPRDLMMIIIDQLDKINNSYAKLKVDKYLPCNCEKCKDSIEPNEYPFETLMKFMKDRQPEIMCNESYKMVSVENLIDDVMERSEIVFHAEDFRFLFKQKTGQIKASNEPPVIYFSYAWGDEHETDESREKMVDELYESLKNTYELKRDKKDLAFGESIGDFMKEIGEGKIILVFISDKYLRSEFCMHELYEIFRNSKLDKGEFRKHVLLFHVENLQLNNATILTDYLQYWSDLEKAWKKVAGFKNAAKSQREKYDKIRTISLEFGNLAEFITDINASKKEILSGNDFEIVKDVIRKRLA